MTPGIKSATSTTPTPHVGTFSRKNWQLTDALASGVEHLHWRSPGHAANRDLGETVDPSGLKAVSLPSTNSKLDFIGADRTRYSARLAFIIFPERPSHSACSSSAMPDH
jgi:hypothetical protein